MVDNDLYSERSYTKCIHSAYDLFSKNVMTILKATWVYALAYALIACLPLIWRFPIVETEADLPKLYVYSVVLILSCVTGLVASGLYNAKIFGLLNGHRLKCNFLRVIRLYLLNAILLFVFLAIATALEYGAYAYSAAHKTGESTALTAMAGIFVVLVIAMGILVLPLAYAEMKYLMENKIRITDAIGKSYRKGWQYWGYLFVAALIALIFCGIGSIIVFFPTLVLAMAQNANDYGVHMGDPDGLPSLFPIARYIVGTLGTISFLYISTWLTFVFYYTYGHIVANQKKKYETKDLALSQLGEEKAVDQTRP